MKVNLCQVSVRSWNSCPWTSGQSPTDKSRLCWTCQCRRRSPGFWSCSPRNAAANYSDNHRCKNAEVKL